MLGALVGFALLLVAWRLRARTPSLNAGLNLVAALLVIVTAAPIVAASVGPVGAGSSSPVATAPDIYVDFRERFGNLFAARVPGHEHLFPDDVTLSQVLPILANTYLGADIDVPPRRFHFSWPDASLDAIEIPDPFVQFGSPP